MFIKNVYLTHCCYKTSITWETLAFFSIFSQATVSLMLYRNPKNHVSLSPRVRHTKSKRSFPFHLTWNMISLQYISKYIYIYTDVHKIKFLSLVTSVFSLKDMRVLLIQLRPVAEHTKHTYPIPTSEITQRVSFSWVKFKVDVKKKTINKPKPYSGSENWAPCYLPNPTDTIIIPAQKIEDCNIMLLCVKLLNADLGVVPIL